MGVSYGSKKLLSVEDCLEILYHNNRFPNQLLLSSKIGQLLSGFAKISEKLDLVISLVNPFISYKGLTREITSFLEIVGKFGKPGQKLTYLGAQEELVGQTVVVV